MHLVLSSGWRWLRAKARRCGRGTTWSYYHALGNTAKQAGIVWKVNGLRHSYISYRLAARPDIGMVALESGNSARVIFQCYRELCAPEEASTWFNVVPASGDAANVVRFAS